MAPAVYRELNIKDLEDLLHGNDEYLELIAQTDYVCSSGGYDFENEKKKQNSNFFLNPF